MNPEQAQQITSDPRTIAYTKAIAYQENGGKPNIKNPSAGKSGEMKSIFQYTPKTWRGYAQQVFGDPNTPMTADNETFVTMSKVHNWIQQGHSIQEIASMWNAGESKKDAYKQNWKGVNSSGVKYDTPAYAKNVANYADKFLKEETVKSQAPSGPLAMNTANSTSKSADPQELLSALHGIIQRGQPKQDPSVQYSPPQTNTGGLIQRALGNQQQ